MPNNDILLADDVATGANDCISKQVDLLGTIDTLALIDIEHSCRIASRTCPESQCRRKPTAKFATSKSWTIRTTVRSSARRSSRPLDDVVGVVPPDPPHEVAVNASSSEHDVAHWGK
jgi:hypothetical protein